MAHVLFALILSHLAAAVIPSMAVSAAAWFCVRFRRCSAADRYVIWWTALLAVAALPWMPVFDAHNASVARPIVLHAAIPHATPQPANSEMDWMVVGGFCWAVLILAQALRLICSLLRALRCKRRATHSGVLAGCRRVAIKRSQEMTAPAAVGFINPAVLLPREGALAGPDEARAVLHEQAHLERFDDWTILAQRIICAGFCFHPLVRWLSRRIDIEREMACDDWVLRDCSSIEYAESLARVAERNLPQQAHVLALFHHRSNFSRRVEAMFDSKRSHAVGISWRVAVSFAAVALCLVCAGMRAPAVWADETPDIGPIVVTAPDGRSASIDADSTETHSKSAFPSGSIVFKQDGRSYVIRDQASVEAAQQIMKPVEEAAEAEGKFGEQEAELGKKMADLANMKVEIDVKQIEAGVREMEQRLSSPEMQKAMKDMEAAQARLGELQSKMGAEMSKHTAEQMSRLAAEQGRLGELQSRIGQRQAEESKRLQEQLEKLVKKAQKQGLAKPID